MIRRHPPIPPVVLAYGCLGVMVFVAPSVIGVLVPALRSAAGGFLALYAALILSFLGGARWGLAIRQSSPDAVIVSFAMVPTLVGLGLLILPPEDRLTQIVGLAGALGLHWLWDATGQNLPPWYPRLRSLLTVGALAGLIAGAAVLT
jgi:Protein of unknown function (DUF3429)